VVYASALPVQSFTCQRRLLVEVLWCRVPDQEPAQHLWACTVSAVSSVIDKLRHYLSHFSPELAAFSAVGKLHVGSFLAFVVLQQLDLHQEIHSHSLVLHCNFIPLE